MTERKTQEQRTDKWIHRITFTAGALSEVMIGAGIGITLSQNEIYYAGLFGTGAAAIAFAMAYRAGRLAELVALSRNHLTRPVNPNQKTL